MRSILEYNEKIKALEKYFGAFPPPFDPPWCVQVSLARCGSNGLMKIVESFFDGNVIYDPRYTKLDESSLEESQDYWKPKGERQYLYYNVGSLEPHEYHTLVCLWCLENVPRVVYIRRKDYLMHAISRFYAAIVWDIERERQVKNRGENLEHYDI